MYTIVYLNTAVSVLTSANISYSQKHCPLRQLPAFIPLKNTPLSFRWHDAVRGYWQRITTVFQQQTLVFNHFMAGVQ